MENELANMNVETGVVVPGAVVGTQAAAEITGTGEVAEPHIDEPPKLTAAEEEAVKRLEKIKDDTKYWRMEKAKARADYFRAPKEEKKEPSVTEDLGIGAEPRLEDFEDFNKYNDAKIQYEVTKARITWDRDQARKQVEKGRQEKMETLQMKISKGFEKYADFEEVAMEQTVPITPVITEILADLDQPEDVAYYLGRNRSEAIQISRMTPIQAARAIAKIELELSKSNPNPPPKKAVTKAPPPINPLNTGGSAVEKDPEKMGQKEYEEWRNSNKARRF